MLKLLLYFKTNDVYYGNTDSLYIENKHWKILGELGLVGKNMFQGKNYYKSGSIWCSLFLAHKTKYCLSIDDHGITSEHKTIKVYLGVQRNLDKIEYFKTFVGEKLVTK